MPLVCPCGKSVCFVAGVAGELDARCASWLVLAETCGVFRLLLSSQCGVDLCVRGPVPQCFVPLVCPCGKCVSLVAGVAGELDARCASWLVLAETCGVFRLVLSSQCRCRFVRALKRSSRTSSPYDPRSLILYRPMIGCVVVCCLCSCIKMVTKKDATRQKKIDSAVRIELLRHSLMFEVLVVDVDDYQLLLSKRS